jgi:hypothetical protein
LVTSFAIRIAPAEKAMAASINIMSEAAPINRLVCLWLNYIISFFHLSLLFKNLFRIVVMNKFPTSDYNLKGERSQLNELQQLMTVIKKTVSSHLLQ